MDAENRTRMQFLQQEYDRADAALGQANIPRLLDGHMASLAERIYCLSAQLVAAKFAGIPERIERLDRIRKQKLAKRQGEKNGNHTNQNRANPAEPVPTAGE